VDIPLRRADRKFSSQRGEQNHANAYLDMHPKDPGLLAATCRIFPNAGSAWR